MFDVNVQGSTVAADYDIFAATGARYKATTLSTTGVSVSGGAGLEVELVSTVANRAVLSAIEISLANSSGVATPTVDVDWSANNGGSWADIALNQTMDRFGRGSYLWTAGSDMVATGTETTEGRIRVTADDGTMPDDMSDDKFLVANDGTNST